jgi:predicted house-cleaning noncanonical NTP pyrophosphatase (MazG superfamily)
MVALGVIPSFKEYLASGGGAQLAPTVEPTTVERMQEISLNLRTTIKELNDDPSNREHLACLLGLVSQVLPAHNASQQYLPEAIKQVRAGNGLSWSDVLDAVTK